MALLALLLTTSLFGTGCMCIGVFFLRRKWSRRHWQAFEGEIISLRSSIGGDNLVYFPTVRVRTGTGCHTFESEFGSYPPPEIGESTAVIGDLRSGQFAQTGTSQFILFGILPICIGIGIVALGWTTYTHNLEPQEQNPIQAYP